MKKKVTIGRKLSLDKETVARLSNEQAEEILGGGGTNNDTCGCMTKHNEVNNLKEDADGLLIGDASCCKGSC